MAVTAKYPYRLTVNVDSKTKQLIQQKAEEHDTSESAIMREIVERGLEAMSNTSGDAYD